MDTVIIFSQGIDSQPTRFAALIVDSSTAEKLGFTGELAAKLVITALRSARPELEHSWRYWISCHVGDRIGYCQQIDGIKNGEYSDLHKSVWRAAQGIWQQIENGSNKHINCHTPEVWSQTVENIERDTNEALKNNQLVVSDEIDDFQKNQGNSPVKPSVGKSKRSATINERMLAMMAENSEAMGWNSPKWARELTCSKAGLVDTKAWKNLKSARLQARAERMNDRRRKPKASDQRRY